MALTKCLKLEIRLFEARFGLVELDLQELVRPLRQRATLAGVIVDVQRPHPLGDARRHHGILVLEAKVEGIDRSSRGWL